jgi:glutamyl-tRNA(Gln) amidotransferase subunit E
MGGTTDRNYEELGFKCGIEIHQQLDTDTKLFCNCSTDVGNQAAVGKIRRQLRPVAGESGEVDRAAKFEYLKNKEFIYNIYRNTSCLVELDEEPPHPINNDALDTALQLALMMGANSPDEIHVMRKTVIDGSNTTGFQRTAIIGLEGHLETEQGTVGIPDLELEEESAGIHTREKEEAVYDLDRLGIPLIEIGTDASIKNPEHAKQVAIKLGMLLRSTRNVKRGLGTIRQDVNVSIEGGSRIEIKGFQDVTNLDQLVRNEVDRQLKLLEIKEQLQDQGIDTINPELHDVTGLFEDSDNQIIQRILESDGAVYATKLPLEGLMNKTLCGDHTLGSELADYAKSQRLKGIMHTDEDISKYGLDNKFQQLAEDLEKQEGEVVVIAAERKETVENGLQTVISRCKQLLEGVPEETRIANQDFTTSYARPLPGSARMYPETDVPPIVIGDDRIERLEDELPETLEEAEERLRDEIGEQFASQLVDSPHFETFEQIKEQFSLDPKTIANFFTNVLKDVESREDVETEKISDQQFKEVLQLLDDEEIGKDALPLLVKQLAQQPEKTPEQIVEEQNIGALGEKQVRNVVKNVIEQKKELIKDRGEHATGALMGAIMQQLQGKADGSMVNRILSEELEKELE